MKTVGNNVCVMISVDSGCSLNLLNLNGCYIIVLPFKEGRTVGETFRK